MKLELHEFYSFKIYQPVDGYRFSHEPFLLAYNETLKGKKNIVDFGSGSGIIAILFGMNNRQSVIYAVEKDETYREIITKNVKLNKLENIKIVESIQNIDANSVDLFVSNPPYFNLKGYRPSKKYKLEKFNDELKDIILGAKRVLKNKGRFKITFHPTRLIELIEVLHKNNFGIKGITPIYGTEKKKACCIIVEALFDSKDHVEFKSPIFLDKVKASLMM